MSRIIGTDSDLSGGLPVSPDATARRAQVEALKVYLDSAPEATDPAVIAVLERMKGQLDFVGSPEAAIDTDSDTSTETGGGDAESTELTAEAPQLAKLKADFDRGIRLIKADRTVEAKPVDITWEKVLARLAEKNTANSEKTNLEMVTAMQGGGEMVGVDENGKLLFKDRGNEPVMFGFDKAGKAVMIYDRDKKQMAEVAKDGKLANYYEVYEAVYGPEGKPTGYELFPDAPDYEKNGAIAAVEDVTKIPFVKSASGKEWRSSWLDNGRKPPKNAAARSVFFDPDRRKTHVRNDSPRGEDDLLGAVRLLRV